MLLVALNDSIALAQTAELSGTITISAPRTSQRIARGQAYRNRLALEKPAEMEPKSSSPFEDVVVSAHPLSFKPELKPLTRDRTIDQRGATFIPRVLPVTQGTVVQFINNDPFYHNVFSLTPGNEFNIGRRMTGEVVGKKIGERKIEGLGEVKIFCDIHTQMSAVILSLDTPYFTKPDANGRYELKNLPEGRYEIRVYHPDLTPVIERMELKGKVEKNFALSN
ncbi:MAG: carboxypeptidase regulatory-like domain-containing protein [Chloroherpetonaceae bacterium]|nr:carboxypeptidase regulatory-like domain-containing protein [Chloroherpetonaceae bacterium]MDW8020664.1 carboxypeptidase regulatory-like domain-containing protein [Chloroherpetonaceae bacterium]